VGSDHKQRKFGLFVAGDATVTFQLERIGGKTDKDISKNESSKTSEHSSAKEPRQIWYGDFLKHDKSAIEIYQYDENQPATERLVAVVSLDKGQNISEITD
jgi:hypothetical protein